MAVNKFSMLVSAKGKLLFRVGHHLREMLHLSCSNPRILCHLIAVSPSSTPFLTPLTVSVSLFWVTHIHIHIFLFVLCPCSNHSLLSLPSSVLPILLSLSLGGWSEENSDSDLHGNSPATGLVFKTNQILLWLQSSSNEICRGGDGFGGFVGPSRWMHMEEWSGKLTSWLNWETSSSWCREENFCLNEKTQ